ncbi:MAG: DMT family transporter [Thalassobaculales bacterium]
MRSLSLALLPGTFVVLWSTGFLGARLGLPHAEPFTFLAVRFALVVALLAPLALLLRTPWPSRRALPHLAVVGVLLHGLYLGGVFAAIARGVPAGLTALIVGLQPLVTAAVVGPLLGESVSRRQWCGLLLGFAGVLLVLSEKLAPAGGSLFDGFDLWGIWLCVVALAGITAGTLYQKRFCAEMDLLSGSAVQYAAAAAFVGALSLTLETGVIDWHPDFVLALAWLGLVLSIGAVTLLWILVRRGEAARTASLFFLVPPCTAVLAYAMFDERLGPAALAGLALAAVGVALARR